MMNDNKFLHMAVEEFRKKKPENSGTKIGDLTVAQLSAILLRAQELKIQENFIIANLESGQI